MNISELNLTGSSAFEKKQAEPIDGGFFEDLFSAFGQGVSSGKTVDEAFDVFKKGPDISGTELSNFIKVVNDMEAYGVTNEQYNYQKEVEDNGGGFFGGMAALAKNPGFLPQLVASSVGTMYGSFVDSDEVRKASLAGGATGLGIGSATGLGALATGAAGAFSGLTGAMETGLTFTDLLKEELGDKDFNKENVRAILEDPVKLKRLKNRSIARGATIGAVEGITFGFARGTGSALADALSKSTRLKRAAGVTLGATGVEMAGGAIGELGGQLAAGQELKGDEIFLEGIAEIKGVVNVSDIIKRAATKTEYGINGKKAEEKDVLDFINDESLTSEEISNANIKVVGNNVLSNLVRKKQLEANIDKNIDQSIKAEDRKKLVDLEIQRSILESNKKNKKGAFKKPKNEQKLNDINNQIDQIIESYEGVETEDIKASGLKGRVETQYRTGVNFAKNNSEIYDSITKITELKTEEEINKYISDNNLNEKQAKAVRGSDGFYNKNTGEIVFNEKVALKKAAVNVGSHELLHGILKKAIKDKVFKGDIKNELKKQFGEQWNIVEERAKAVDKDGKRIYSDDYLAKNPDEWITLTSDAIQTGDIKFNEDIFTKIGDILAPILRVFGFRKIGFENGQQVYNFLKEYNKSIHSGALSSNIIKATARPGVSPGFTQTQADLVTSLSPEARKKSTERINELGKVDEDGNNLEEQGTGNFYYEAEADNIANKIQQEGLLDALILSRPHQGIDDETFLNTTYSELLPHIRNYKPEQQLNVDPSKRTGLFGWINTQLKNKATQAFNKLQKGAVTAPTVEIGQTTKEGDIKVQVEADPDVELEAFELEDLSPSGKTKKILEEDKKKQTVRSKLRRALNIDTGSDLYNKVLSTARKALIRAYETGENVRKIQVKLRNEANNYIFKDVKNFLGTTQYISNLKNFREAIIESLFTSDLVQLEREVPNEERVFTKFVKKLTSIEEVQNAVDNNLLPPSEINKIKKGQAVNLYKKVLPIEKDFIAFFDQPAINPKTGARSGLKGTRKDALAKYLAGALSMDATMQVANEQEVKQKRIDLADLQGKTLAENDLQTLAVTIGRQVDLVFSNNLSRDISNIKAELTEIESKVKARQKILTQIRVLQNKEDEVSELTRNILEDVDNLFALNIPIREAYNIVTNKLSVKQKNINVLDIDQLVQDIKNTKVGELRDEAHKISVEYLRNKIQNKSLEQQHKIINDFLKYFGRPTRASMANGVTTNEMLLNVLKEELGINMDSYSLQDVENGKTIAYKGKPVKMLERISNIKVNARDNNELEQNVNKQSEETQAFVLDFFDPKNNDTTEAEKLVLLQLISYGQLSPVRKLPKLGITTKQGSYTANQLILEHRVANKKTVDKIRDYIKGDISKAEMQDYFNKPEFTVNVLTKSIDNILTEKGLKQSGGFNRYDDNDFLLALKSDENLILTEEIQNLIDNNLSDNQTIENVIVSSYSTQKDTKGITVLDFDDTLATTKSMIRFVRPDGTEGKLNAEQYASTYEDLLKLGYKFNFDEFKKVVDGKPAPLLNKAKKLASKFGTKDMFILTARPQESAPAIKKFLKENGLDIPLKNITGLGNSTSEAKALWVLKKAEQGYNDFYFADDALQNVQAVNNMLEQIDVKRKVQQAKLTFSNTINKDFNKILQEVSGIEAKERFSEQRSKRRGANKGKYRFFIPPSHEDFIGLLYNFMGKGKVGNRHMRFFEKALIKPLNRAFTKLNAAKQVISSDYKALIKQNKDIESMLTQKLPDSDFTYEDAIRVYLWDKFGFTIPGLNATEQKNLARAIKSDKKLRQFADKVGKISRIQEGYVTPGEEWTVGSVKFDLVDATGRVGRAKFFTEFKENADIIFSPENINKIRAIYGDNFVDALQNMLSRILTGNNRPVIKDKRVNDWLDWINGSVGATMFINIRSALLQQLSFVNFINFADNNIFKAAFAYANQKQFWSDFSMIFNSDYLKQRRAGAAFDVNTNEIAREVSRSRNKARAAIKYLLNIGFTPTQLGDSFAIAAGGAAFYRNRVNTYLSQGLSKTEAETKAFEDFREVAESTQQSARPDMTSQQQNSVLGRLILAFQNVTSQYMRLVKKAGLDLLNRRTSRGYATQGQSDMANISKIIYYGAAQSIIFYGLQTALFAMMFEDDEKDDKFFKTKKDRTIHGVLDSALRGIGIYGAVLSTLKNTVIKFVENQKDPSFFKSKAWEELLQISPPIGIKVRKLAGSENTTIFNKKVMKEMETFDIDNPLWDAVTGTVEGITNIPVNRLHTKVDNIRAAFDNENAWWQRVATIAGWNRWTVGVKNTAIEEARQRVKQNQKLINKQTKLEKASPEEKIKIIEKSIFDLNKRQQVKILNDNNVNPDRYPREADRVNAIMKLRNINKSRIDSTIRAIETYIPTEAEQRTVDLFKMNKKQQVDLLIDLGVSISVIKTLKYEEDRVNKIVEVEKRKSKK